MARIAKPETIKTGSVLSEKKTENKLPESGMVDIIFKGEVKNVSTQLAKTLIDKGAAKLKV